MVSCLPVRFWGVCSNATPGSIRAKFLRNDCNSGTFILFFNSSHHSCGVVNNNWHLEIIVCIAFALVVTEFKFDYLDSSALRSCCLVTKQILHTDVVFSCRPIFDPLPPPDPQTCVFLLQPNATLLFMMPGVLGQSESGVHVAHRASSSAKRVLHVPLQRRAPAPHHGRNESPQRSAKLVKLSLHRRVSEEAAARPEAGRAPSPPTWRPRTNKHCVRQVFHLLCASAVSHVKQAKKRFLISNVVDCLLRAIRAVRGV